MTAIFDTLSFAEKLTEAGMDPKQSKAFAQAMHDVAFAEVATKTDLRDAVQSLTLRGIAASVVIVGALATIIKL
jgi:hypothetical protein